jgi:hypothetical protein
LFIVFGIACAYPPAFPLLCYVVGAACFIAAGVRLAGAITDLSGAKS